VAPVPSSVVCHLVFIRHLSSGFGVQAAVNYWPKANRPEIKPLLAYPRSCGKIENLIVSKVEEADHDHFTAL
jgi:hypothetical protein